MHRVERQMESNEEQPEVPFAEGFIQHPACRLGKPVIDGGKDHENDCTDDDVMEMGNDEVGICELPVEGCGGEHDPRKSGD